VKTRALLLVTVVLLASCGQSIISDKEIEQIRIDARDQAVDEYWHKLYADPQAMYDAWLSASCDLWMRGEMAYDLNLWFEKTYDVVAVCLSYPGNADG
jgi:hypothetical protein